MQFLCPNGHKISCPDEQAGRAAKCPKCGIKFQIPELSETEGHEVNASDSEVSTPEFANSDLSLGAPEGSGSSVERQIEFLCPNGHRLHGPASLQGKPGQCPDCGSKFRIPVYDDIADDEETSDEEIQVGRPAGKPDSTVPVSGSTHAMVKLLARMWPQKSRGATIELHLSDGTTIEPDRFAMLLSKADYGLFATTESEDSHTLIAVSWDSVVRVVAKGIASLPDEFAD